MEYPDGCRWDERSRHLFEIESFNQQSATIFIDRQLKYSFENEDEEIPLDVHIQLKSSMSTKSSSSIFEIEHQLKIDNQKKPIFQRTWNFQFPRLYN